MKLKMAIAAAALVLLGAPSAQAQLSITLDSLVETAIPDPDPAFPGHLWAAFNGVITNDSDAPITVVGNSLAVPAGVIEDTPHDDLDLGTFGPDFVLGPGDSFRGDWLFGMHIPSSVTESFGATYSVLAQDAQGNDLDPFSIDVRVNLQGTVVPEPGAMALLVSGLVGGSLFLTRRRK